MEIAKTFQSVMLFRYLCSLMKARSKFQRLGISEEFPPVFGNFENPGAFWESFQSMLALVWLVSK